MVSILKVMESASGVSASTPGDYEIQAIAAAISGEPNVLKRINKRFQLNLSVLSICLVEAIRYGNMSIVTYIRKHVTDFAKLDLFAAMYAAARTGYLEVLQYLTSLHGYENTPWAACISLGAEGRHISIVNFAIDCDDLINPDYRCSWETEGMEGAALSGDPEMVKFVASKCEPNAWLWNWCMYLAAERGYLSVVQYAMSQLDPQDIDWKQFAKGVDKGGDPAIMEYAALQSNSRPAE